MLKNSQLKIILYFFVKKTWSVKIFAILLSTKWLNNTVKQSS